MASHLHVIATDGCRSPDGSWHTPAEWDAERLMRLFREQLLGSLLDKRAISQELVGTAGRTSGGGTKRRVDL